LFLSAMIVVMRAVAMVTPLVNAAPVVSRRGSGSWARLTPMAELRAVSLSESMVAAL
jgi:hypothetical protein